MQTPQQNINDMSTREVVDDLLDRIKHSNGLEFVETLDLVSLVNSIFDELDREGRKNEK